MILQAIVSDLRPDRTKLRHRYLRALVVSLALHLVSFGALFMASRKDGVRTKSPVSSTAITVKVVQVKPQLQVGVGAKTPAERPKNELKAQGQGRIGTQKAYSSATRRALTYGELLPGAQDLQATGVLGGEMAVAEEWSTGPVASSLQISSEVLAGSLDIPLAARMAGISGKAVAKIMRDKGGKLHFASVDGLPLLRAVLYEELRSAKNRVAILDWLEQMATNEVLLILKLNVGNEAGAVGSSDSLSYAQGRMLIERTVHNRTTSGGAAIPLPDEEAERAKHRDQVHWQRLTQSPAFRSRIGSRPCDESRL